MREKPPPDAVRTRSCTLWLAPFTSRAAGPASLVHGLFHPNAEVSVDDARENLDVTRRLCAGKKLPILVDLRPVRSQSADARALFAGPEAMAVSLAVALVIGSPLSRVIGNFFLGFNRPAGPTRLFGSVDEAEAWLSTFEIAA